MLQWGELRDQNEEETSSHQARVKYLDEYDCGWVYKFETIVHILDVIFLV